MPNNLDRFVGPEQLPTQWPWRVLLFSFLLFLITIIGYFGLAFGYKPFLNSKIIEKDQEIAALAQTIPTADQQTLVKFYSQLGNLQEVLRTHIFGSKILPILEKYTNKQVYYKSFNLNIVSSELILEGVAQSYEILAQQLEAYKQAPEVERFVVNQAETQAGKANFKATLFLKTEIFK